MRKLLHKKVVLYPKSIDNKLNISQFQDLFSDLEFNPLSGIEAVAENILGHNGIIVISLEDLDFITKELEKHKYSKFLLIVYDPEEKVYTLPNLSTNVYDIITEPISNNKVVFSLNKVFTTLKSQIELMNLNSKYEMQTKELHTLNSIGISLSTERDVDKLLETILIKCREITHSDSGSLYIVQEQHGTEADPYDYFKNKELLFKLAQNDSIQVDFQERILELNKKSISGYVALTGKPLLLKDAYELSDDSEYSFNKWFDQHTGYRSKSMLIVPMINQKSEVIGVIQLINKKIEPDKLLSSPEVVEDIVIEFEESDQDLVYSLASQAAILIDNTKLYYNIKTLFEGFIKASVTAIEARDPTTSGHSERVADLTVGLAEIADSSSHSIFKEIKFTRNDIQQIKYASLLHDFGKIGVREDVLVKAKKLYPFELELLVQRFKYMKKSMELNLANAKLDYILEHPKEKALLYFSEIEGFYQEKIQELDNTLSVIIASNEPSVLAQEASQKLREFSSMFFEDLDRSQIPYLTPYELESLSIARGSLRDQERLEIESHVTHTYEFLSKIPWTTELKKVPEIAYSHHEKLDGTGYPRRVSSENIPTPSKMMAISDIYDALTASDRPYKKALPVEKALDILGFEVKANKLDSDLFKLFVDAKIYEIIKKE